ncbi:MAG: hypothetical protein LBJ84_00980 [Oscillospiraceae bacterium]|nr:hypothetical protein [Oscillospiraceae bacterium]
MAWRCDEQELSFAIDSDDELDDSKYDKVSLGILYATKACLALTIFAWSTSAQRAAA